MRKWVQRAVLIASGVMAQAGIAKEIQLLNVSYDPTREFYQAYNLAFSEYWQQKSGDKVTIRQSHGGSGKQATSVINGLEADVVTLALAYDVDAIAQRGRIDPHWNDRLPQHSAPYTSTIVFLVRKGNPKQIKDWPDLIKPGVAIITPNPKTSGGARWNYLAAWGYALHHNNNDPVKAQEFVQTLFHNVMVLDSGARGSTITFTERGLGDVLIAWENEALQAVNAMGKDEYEIITPSESILTEPVVSVVDKVVDKRATREVATAYLDYLYSTTGQTIAAQYYYRPRDLQAINAKDQQTFTLQHPPLKLFTVDDTFGGWTQAQRVHFTHGGTFDQISRR